MGCNLLISGDKIHALKSQRLGLFSTPLKDKRLTEELFSPAGAKLISVIIVSKSDEKLLPPPLKNSQAE